MKKLNHHIVGWALLLIFIGYLGSIVATTHFNLIDGVLVVHAHKQTEKQKSEPFHKHTASELVQLHQISDLSTTGINTTFSILEPLFFYIIKLETWEQIFVSSHFFHKVIRRGPPSIEL